MEPVGKDFGDFSIIDDLRVERGLFYGMEEDCDQNIHLAYAVLFSSNELPKQLQKMNEI